MPEFKDLVKDIYSVLGGAVKVPPEAAKALGERLGGMLVQRLSEESGSGDATLRMSNLGTRCLRKLWYSINQPEKAEKLPPWTRLKFLYGDIIEELVLWLAEVSGHEVKDRQREVSLHGVRGHLDAFVDGVLVDVKSASGYGFGKFQEGIKPESDTFGYLRQLGGYREASKADEAAFIAVDKSQGHICVDEHSEHLDVDYEAEIHTIRSVISGAELPPRAYSDEKDGESGNRKLGVSCSYCAFKSSCWPGLKGFAYSPNPRYLTVVKRQPAPHIVEIPVG